MLQDFVSNPEALERVDPAGGEREIDRAAADKVAGMRIGPALEEFHLVAAPPEKRGHHAAGQTAADEEIPGHGRRIGESLREERGKSYGPPQGPAAGWH